MARIENQNASGVLSTENLVTQISTNPDIQAAINAAVDQFGWQAEVTAYANLPAAADHSGEAYYVLTETGFTLFPLAFPKASGLYRSDGASWIYAGKIANVLDDSTSVFYDENDNTKSMRFQLSGITTANQRVMTIPDKDITIAGTDDVATKVTANTAITGATKTKITYDSKGLVTAGADAAASDITASTTNFNHILSSADNTVQKALDTIDNNAPQIHTSTSYPTATNDGADTAGLGKKFAIGDIWLVTTTCTTLRCCDATTNAAVWDVNDYQYLQFYGDKSAGNLTLSSGTTTLSTDGYYDVITLTGTGAISPAGYRLHCHTLDISNAGANAIVGNGNNGNNASGATGGSLATIQSGNSIGGTTRGTVGVTATTGTGGVNTAPGAATANGGVAGVGGTGGTGGAGAAASPVSVNAINRAYYRRPELNYLRSAAVLVGGHGGSSGCAGSGDTTNTGGGSGAGGNSGRLIMIFAKNIICGSNSTAGVISVNGGNGGNGANSSAGNTGGGGGGAGGGGGTIYIVTENITGSITNGLSANGGNGGNGGTGFGTGTAGGGGYGGAGGHIIIVNNRTRTCTVVDGTTAVAPSGATGGTGQTLQMNLA